MPRGFVSSSALGSIFRSASLAYYAFRRIPRNNRKRVGGRLMREVDFQAWFVAQVKELGGFSKKLNSKTNGMLDTFVQLPGDPFRFVEFKFFEMPKRYDTPIKVELTALQRKFIRDMQASGGHAGWLIAHKAGRGAYFAMAGNSHTIETVSQSLFAASCWGLCSQTTETEIYKGLLSHI